MIADWSQCSALHDLALDKDTQEIDPQFIETAIFTLVSGHFPVDIHYLQLPKPCFFFSRFLIISTYFFLLEPKRMMVVVVHRSPIGGDKCRPCVQTRRAITLHTLHILELLGLIKRLQMTELYACRVLLLTLSSWPRASL